MSWPMMIAHDHAFSESAIVIEGKIAWSYRGLIPGVMPRVKGTHWLFERNPSIVRASRVGHAIAAAFPEIGFWTLPGDLSIPCGTEIRASLVLHRNKEQYLTLMPYPCCPDAVLGVPGRERLLYNYGQPVPDLPLTFAFYFYVDSSKENEINGWQSPFYDAWSILKTASSNLTMQELAFLDNMGEKPVHYIPSFVDYIPPDANGAPQPLAQTHFPLDRAPQKGDFLSQWFNKSYPWAPSPSNGDTVHYDFISIAAHETGHALGLAHVTDDPTCLMFPTFSPGPERRTLCGEELFKLFSMYK